MCEPAPDDTRYHCLELCWLRSPFSPQEGKRNPPKRHCYTVLKNFPSDRVNRDSVEALFVAILHSGALLGLCWGTLGAPHRTPPSLRAPFPSAPALPGDTVCPLSSSTQAGIQHLLTTLCWLSFICISSGDLSLLLHGLAYWPCQL